MYKFIILALFALFAITAHAQNIALNKPVTASSEHPMGQREARLANDGNGTTRWSSVYNDTEWWQVDLGAVYTLSEIRVTWETAYGSDFDINVSNDEQTWRTIVATRGNTSQSNVYAVNDSARFVRLAGIKRATPYGYSIYDFQVFGSTAPTFTPVNPSCYPSQSELRWKWEGAHVYLLWYCDTPKFIQRSMRAYDLASPLRIVSPEKLTSMSQADLLKADRLATTRQLTASEEAALETLHNESGIKITVAPNGTTLTRPVYAATPTNTRGATTTKRATVGDPCGRRRLQDDTGKGTMYFEVDGGYTLCKINGVISK